MPLTIKSKKMQLEKLHWQEVIDDVLVLGRVKGVQTPFKSVPMKSFFISQFQRLKHGTSRSIFQKGGVLRLQNAILKWKIPCFYTDTDLFFESSSQFMDIQARLDGTKNSFVFPKIIFSANFSSKFQKQPFLSLFAAKF